MIYVQRTPAAPLNQHVRLLWHAQAPKTLYGRERVLPTGYVQIILNLARDFVWDCPEGEKERQRPPSLIVGARSSYEIVDRSDMADLMGIIFQPGGFAAFSGDAVHAFSNRNVSLEEVWGAKARALRDWLREAHTTPAKLCALEQFLLNTFANRLPRNAVVDFALQRFARNSLASSVKEVASETGWSTRHFTQIFREQVGLSPKVWCRIRRFQKAVQQLHVGVDVSWADLALECGYYDQSHFANEFRAFSGIDATSYTAGRTLWANHVPVS